MLKDIKTVYSPEVAKEPDADQYLYLKMITGEELFASKHEEPTDGENTVCAAVIIVDHNGQPVKDEVLTTYHYHPLGHSLALTRNPSPCPEANICRETWGKNSIIDVDTLNMMTRRYRKMSQHGSDGSILESIIQEVMSS